MDSPACCWSSEISLSILILLGFEAADSQQIHGVLNRLPRQEWFVDLIITENTAWLHHTCV